MSQAADRPGVPDWSAWLEASGASRVDAARGPEFASIYLAQETAIAGYGVAPRQGWPAINFFYNTAFDAHNAYVLDEPWSRPGDYVLLRADVDPCEPHALPPGCPGRRRPRASEPMPMLVLVHARTTAAAGPRDTVRARDIGRGRQSHARGTTLKPDAATLSRPSSHHHTKAAVR